MRGRIVAGSGAGYVEELWSSPKEHAAAGLADQQQPSSTIGDFALHNIALERLIGIGDWRPSSSVDRAIWGAPAVETLLRATKMRSGAISRLAPPIIAPEVRSASHASPCWFAACVYRTTPR
jgi:hypothetical protein